MNNLDKKYQELLQDILENGVKKETRNGGTISVFGRQIKHKMSEGFPLLTTKKMPFKTITTELLWFLRGDSDIRFLWENNCKIWDGDWEKNYKTTCSEPYTIDEVKQKVKDGNHSFHDSMFDMGPIYGKQWRSWGRKNVTNYDLENVKSSDKVKVMDLIHDGGDYSKYDVKVTYQNNSIDQIANLINDLKTNPDSRRLMVNAWNVGELDQMVLPPCHYVFQVYTRELSISERVNLFMQGKKVERFLEKITNKDLDAANIPTRSISLMWNQRSVDTFLGLPFNIASYGLLLEILSKEVNMVPDELIGNLGDTHLYLNHIEQAKEQIGRQMTWEEKIQWVIKNTGLEMDNVLITEELYKKTTPTHTREPFELPTLNQFPTYTGTRPSIESYVVGDFTLKDYQSHPPIKAPLSN
jgi:thymidylate synthase